MESRRYYDRRDRLRASAFQRRSGKRGSAAGVQGKAALPVHASAVSEDGHLSANDASRRSRRLEAADGFIGPEDALAAIDTPAAGPRVSAVKPRSMSLRLAQTLFCLGAGAAVWLSPLAVSANTKAALAISAMMIIAWMTEVMEYASAGLVGLFLFWFFGIAKPEVIFSGFVNDASWFYIGAVFLGTMATKTGLPMRNAGFVVNRVGLTYSRLLLGLVVISFLLTFIV